MGGPAGAIIASVVGAVLAIGAAFGIVSSQTATPAPVDKPFIVYGELIHTAVSPTVVFHVS